MHVCLGFFDAASNYTLRRNFRGFSQTLPLLARCYPAKKAHFGTAHGDLFCSQRNRLNHLKDNQS